MSDKYRLLRGRMVEKYGSVKAFVRETNSTYQNVINKLNGKTKINTKEVQEWAEVLDIENEEVGRFFMP